MIFRLDENNLSFPDPALAEADGLLAIGGDLSTERLLHAYRNGIFPWFNEDDPLLWFSPHERCVIFPDRINISKSMQNELRKERFRLTENQAFEEVIAACATVPRTGQQGTWINSAMQEAYTRLHRQGVAQSIEVWMDGELAGGLYGLKMGTVFCGESMFSKAANASKAALIYLARKEGLTLIDCQLPNSHLMRMGAEMISREAYMALLTGGSIQ